MVMHALYTRSDGTYIVFRKQGNFNHSLTLNALALCPNIALGFSAICRIIIWRLCYEHDHGECGASTVVYRHSAINKSQTSTSFVDRLAGLA